MLVNVKYSIVIPAYNEEDNLRVLLPAMKKVLAQYLSKLEIIVVDTQRTLDNTKTVCVENNVKYVNRFPGDYYGDAVRVGINMSKGEWIMFMDADGSHPPGFIPYLFEAVNRGCCDVAIASRYIKGGGSENNSCLVYMSKLLNIIYARSLRINCFDISNSFKVYKASLLKSITLQCGHFDIIEEIICKLSKQNHNLKIVEMPFTFNKRIYGKSKRKMVVFMANYFATLIKLIWYRYFQ